MSAFKVYPPASAGYRRESFAIDATDLRTAAGVMGERIARRIFGRSGELWSIRTQWVTRDRAEGSFEVIVAGPMSRAHSRPAESFFVKVYREVN